MSPQMIPMGIKIGKTPARKSCNWVRRLFNSRATYVTNTTLAKSDVCSVSPTKGMRSQRLASLMSAPNAKVKISRTAATQMSTWEIREKYRKLTL